MENVRDGLSAIVTHTYHDRVSDVTCGHDASDSDRERRGRRVEYGTSGARQPGHRTVLCRFIAAATTGRLFVPEQPAPTVTGQRLKRVARVQGRARDPVEARGHGMQPAHFGGHEAGGQASDGDRFR